jgi:hypothetical protein
VCHQDRKTVRVTLGDLPDHLGDTFAQLGKGLEAVTGRRITV